MPNLKLIARVIKKKIDQVLTHYYVPLYYGQLSISWDKTAVHYPIDVCIISLS